METNARARSRFNREVRRDVVDFVVGRVLTADGEDAAPAGLDDPTAYYLLHRHDFGMDAAPAGACILYAQSCTLSDRALADRLDLLARPGKTGGEGGAGATLKLKAWDLRRARNLGMDAPGGGPAPLIDRIHKLMQLWRAGDSAKVDAWLEARALKRDALFHRVLQALIELADAGSGERSILESLSNHATTRDRRTPPRQRTLRV